MSHLLPAALMFAITVAVVTALLFPATFDRASKLVNFYWVGLWVFLAVIASISGGAQTVDMLGMNTMPLAARLQFAATLCFVIFVVFAWFRLSGAALVVGYRRLRA